MYHSFTLVRRSPSSGQQDLRNAWAAAAGAFNSIDEDALIFNDVLAAIPDLTPAPLWDAISQIGIPSPEDRVPSLGARTTSSCPAVDRSQFVQFVARERVVIDGPRRGIKFFSLPRRLPGLNQLEFSHHYGSIHGALVARDPSFSTKVNRYVQHHVMAETVRVADGFLPYDGVSEYWFDSLDAARAAWGDFTYIEELRADEKRFVFAPPSHRMAVVESTGTALRATSLQQSEILIPEAWQ